MNQDIKQRWIDALRSGQYKQGIGFLRNAQDQFCCLGVLCDLYVKENAKPGSDDDWEEGSEYNAYDYCLYGVLGALPEAVMQWAGVDSMNPLARYPNLPNHRFTTLAALNDSQQVTFDDIAAVIEEQL